MENSIPILLGHYTYKILLEKGYTGIFFLQNQLWNWMLSNFTI